MNQRIRQLAEQARKKRLGDSWSYTNPAEFEQKFAELIVAECIDTYDHWATHSMDKTAFVVARTHVKEHFGIEQ
jgi:hypothetical protein